MKSTMKNSVYFRIGIVFLAIMIPIVMIYVGLYQYGIRSTKNYIGTLSQAQNDFNMQHFESEIRKVELLQYELYNDENLLFLSLPTPTLTPFERDRYILGLQQRLDTIKSSSNFVSDIHLFIPKGEVIITPTTSSTSLEKIASFTSRFSGRNKAIESIDGNISMAVVYPISTAQDLYASQYAIIIDFSNVEILKMLDTVDTNSNNHTLMFTSDLWISANENLATPENREWVDRYISSALMEAGNHSSNGNLLTASIMGEDYFAVYTFSEYLGVTLIQYLPQRQVLQEVSIFHLWIWVLAIIGCFILFIFLISLYRIIYKPLNKLLNAFRVVKTGDLSIKIQHKSKDEFQDIYTEFHNMVSDLQLYIDLSYNNKIMAQEAELKQLQAQINPHFLYNSFFMLQKRVKYGDTESAVWLAEHLGSFFRYITKSAEQDVSLFQEVEHARIYTEIQAERFRGRITVDFEELPCHLEQVLIPRVILQPIVENAFLHSLEDMEENGYLSISFNSDKGLIYIHVEDNGRGMSEDEKQYLMEKMDDSDIETTGIINTHRRLKLKFGSECGIMISNGKDGGTRVTLVLKQEHDYGI